MGAGSSIVFPGNQPVRSGQELLNENKRVRDAENCSRASLAWVSSLWGFPSWDYPLKRTETTGLPVAGVFCPMAIFHVDIPISVRNTAGLPVLGGF